MKFSRYIVLALKGCAMGMADVVPGVSGGTIAFISGIYEELLDSIRSVDATALRLLLRFRLAEFWRHINGRFLLPVLLGIAVAIFSLARLMTYLLRADRGCGAARRQTDRPRGLADRAGFRRRGRRGVVDHRRNARRNA